MDNTGITPPATTVPPNKVESRHDRSGIDWLGLVLLSLLVIFVGGLTGLFGPLFAISCDSCQDGVRSDSAGLALLPVALGLVPLVTVGSVIGMFLPRGGARVGGLGLGALVVLFVVMQVLGTYPG